MRGALTVGVVAAGVALLLPAEPAISSLSQADASGASCRYVVKKVRGHKKRVRVCKAKPKPKPKPKPAPKPQADLSVTVSSSLPRITAGNQVVYDVGLRNLGPEPASGVELSIAFPAGAEPEPHGFAIIGQSEVSDVSCEGSATSEDAPFVWRCTLGDLQPAGTDGTPSVWLSYLIEATREGQLAVTAQAKASTSDPHPANNQATASTLVMPGPAAADLSVAVDAAPNPATVPDDYRQTIRVTNSGPAEATSVRVGILLPLGAEVVDVQGESFSEQCQSSGPNSFAITLCWDVVPAGGTVAATVVLAPLAGAPPTLETNLVVSAHTPDHDPTDNRVTTITPLAPFRPGPGIDLVAFLSPPRLVSPQLVSGEDEYIIVPFAVGNRGSDEAQDAHVILTVAGPVGNGGVGFNAGGFSPIGACDQADSTTFDCVVRSVKSGGRASGFFFAELSGAGEVRVTLTAVSATAEANPADNTATVTLLAK